MVVQAMKNGETEHASLNIARFHQTIPKRFKLSALRFQLSPQICMHGAFSRCMATTSLLAMFALISMVAVALLAVAEAVSTSQKTDVRVSSSYRNGRTSLKVSMLSEEVHDFETQ